jgi:hypothetical protein
MVLSQSVTRLRKDFGVLAPLIADVLAESPAQPKAL